MLFWDVLLMAFIKFLTWNVRGLREKIKRTAAFTFLKKQHADVVVLVETHVEGRLQLAHRHPWVGWAFHSTHTSHARGVSILIAKSAHFELCEVSTDPQGCYVFLFAKLYGKPFLILAFYVPPLIQHLHNQRETILWPATPQYKQFGWKISTPH